MLAFCSSSWVKPLVGFLVLSLLPTTAYADLDVSSVLKGNIKGQTIPKGKGPFDITIVSDGTDVVIAMSVPLAQSKIGWVAVGVGDTMAGADMYIAWPNSDGSWTLSHRTSQSTEMPKTKSGGTLSIVDSLTTKTASAAAQVFALKRPLTGSGLADIGTTSAVPFIYAFSSKNPGSNDAGTDLDEHDAPTAKMVSPYDTITVDMTKAFSSGASGGGGGGSSAGASAGATSAEGGATPSTDSAISSSSSGSSSGLDSGDDAGTKEDPVAAAARRAAVVKAHAVLGALVWLVFSPIAVLIARGKRSAYRTESSGPGWRKKHEGLQFFNFALTVATVCLGMAIINGKKTPHFQNSHHIVGVVLLLVGFTIQLTLGYIIHMLKWTGAVLLPFGLVDRGRARIQMRNWFHIILGLALTGGGIWQCWTGLALLPLNQVFLPGFATTAFNALVGVFIGIYVLLVLVLIFSRKKAFSRYLRVRPRAWKIALFGLDQEDIRQLAIDHQNNGMPSFGTAKGGM